MQLYAIRNTKTGDLLRATSASILEVDGGDRISGDVRYLQVDSAMDLVDDNYRRCLFVTPDLEFLAELLRTGSADDFKYPYRFKPGFRKSLADYEPIDLMTGLVVELPPAEDGGHGDAGDEAAGD